MQHSTLSLSLSLSKKNSCSAHSHYFNLYMLSYIKALVLISPTHYPSMSILPQHHVRTCHHQALLPTRVYCSAATTTTTKPKRRNPDQLVLVTPPPISPARIRTPVLDDPNLQSTWAHRAWVASGCTTVAIPLAKSIMGASNSHMWVEPILAGLVGYVLADLGSGVYHWAIDNYGDASSPIFGTQIDAFQGHHKWPWTITRRQFANNLHALARSVTFVVLPMSLTIDDPMVNAFVALCSGCIMFSQQFHAWAHGTKSRLPPLVVALQDAGILVSRSQHAAHHLPPYNNNYCIVNGIWNEFLDKQKVFETLEMVLFFKLGVRPRSWSEPNSNWTEEAQTPSSQITAS